MFKGLNSEELVEGKKLKVPVREVTEVLLKKIMFKLASPGTRLPGEMKQIKS